VVHGATPAVHDEPVLSQIQGGTERPVAFASRSLNAAEQKYLVGEREALACVWACERWHMYVYEQHFTLRTDHQGSHGPVLYIGVRHKPLRIYRWSERLQPYDFTTLFTPGRENVVADLLSCAPPQPRRPTPPTPARRPTWARTQWSRSSYSCFTPRSRLRFPWRTFSSRRRRTPRSPSLHPGGLARESPGGADAFSSGQGRADLLERCLHGPGSPHVRPQRPHGVRLGHGARGPPGHRKGEAALQGFSVVAGHRP